MKVKIKQNLDHSDHHDVYSDAHKWPILTITLEEMADLERALKAYRAEHGDER